MRQLVIPRDFFNDSKLLKSLGKLSLIIHDGMDDAGNRSPLPLEIRAYTYCILQNPVTGNLFASGVHVTYRGCPVLVCSLYNSKANYNLWVDTDTDCVEVLDSETGCLTTEFLAYLQNRFEVSK
jgi:hypothetical protein